MNTFYPYFQFILVLFDNQLDGTQWSLDAFIGNISDRPTYVGENISSEQTHECFMGASWNKILIKHPTVLKFEANVLMQYGSYADCGAPAKPEAFCADVCLKKLQ